MDLTEAVKARKSIRDFTAEPVSRETLKAVLEIAVRAPSGVNCQAWEFAVVAGEALDKIRAANIELLHEGITNNNLPRDSFEKGTIYRKRQVDLAIQLFDIMGIARDDLEKRLKWMERGFRFFNAPAAIILLSDNSLSDEYPSLDIGAVMYGICLAALKFNLGTCIEDQGKMFEAPLRKYAGIPDSKKIHTTIAIGHPNWDFPANRIVTPREDVDNITIWRGFEDD
jgi:nitroreductase